MKNISSTLPIFKMTSNSLKQSKQNCSVDFAPVNQNTKEITSTTSNAIRNNVIPFISFKASATPNTIEEIVAKLDKEYGIKSEFDSLEMAKLTLEGVEEFVKLNNKDMFKGLVIEKYDEEASGSFYSYRANFNDKSFTLRLNNNKTLEQVEKETKEDFENCKIGAGDKKYYLYEVLGHFLNFKYNPYAFINNTKQNNFSDIARTIALKIGGYSQESIGRFNASYIATKMCGQNLPPKAKDVYEDCVGADLNFPEEKVTKIDLGIVHNFENVEEASQYLKQYGIEAKFENIVAANLTVGAIEDFIKINENPKMFKGLKIGVDVDPNSNVLGGVHSIFDYDTNQIKLCELNLNPSYDWNRHNKRCDYNYETGHYASNHPKYSLYHELGHWLHFQKMPREYSFLNDSFKYGRIYINETGKINYGKISGYAQSTTIEYVAETIAAKMCGLKFPQSSMQEFNELNKTLNLKFPN